MRYDAFVFGGRNTLVTVFGIIFNSFNMMTFQAKWVYTKRDQYMILPKKKKVICEKGYWNRSHYGKISDSTFCTSHIQNPSHAIVT